MSKTQSILRLIRSDLSFFALILITIISLFTFLSPKISSQVFPFKRQAILNEFINATKQRGSIDPQEYWQFREFYSPGYFIFSRTGIEKSSVQQSNEKIGIKYDEKQLSLTFLVFSSPLANSLDILTTESDLNKIVDLKQFSKENFIFADKNSLIYREDSRTIKIIFLMDNSKMRIANGYFDYGEKDKLLVENKNWFNVTVIKEYATVLNLIDFIYREIGSVFSLFYFQNLC